MDLTNPSEIKQLLKEYETSAKKSLGQNFLINRGILEEIIKTAEISSDEIVVEVGPGLGVLTLELCKEARKVISIELDQDIIPILKKNLKEAKNLEILNENALDFIPPENYKVVANIPYYITSPLINHFLRAKNKPKSITLLVQYEVARKICQKEPDMSVLSLQVALFAKAKPINKVKAGNFYPAPKVDSAIIHITPHSTKDPDFLTDEEAIKILKLAKKAFSQKRKKLSNTLPEFKDKKIDLDLNRRPQTLSVQEWQKMLEYQEI